MRLPLDSKNVRNERARRPSRLRWVAGALFAVVVSGAVDARAVELVPAVGMSRSVKGASDTKVYGSLAVRSSMLPMLDSELAVAYRDESRFDDKLKVRMWPVTASLWLRPIPSLYAGAGVGWYQTTYDYDSSVPGVHDETRQQFGVHLGGGVQMPIAPSLGLDLGGRYVMMRDQQSQLVPEKFDPDFWVSSVGLAFKF